MTMLRVILSFSLITLLLFSRSRQTSAAAADHEAGDGVLIPYKRALLSQPVKAGGENIVADVDNEVSSLPQNLGIHVLVRKVRGGGIATRARGRTSSAAPSTQLSFFHLASVLGCSLFLGFTMF